MEDFKKTNLIKSSINDLELMNKQFISFSVNEELTNSSILRAFNKYKVVIDPHTAVGLEAANQYITENKESVVVTLATAHPAKFSDSVKSSENLKQLNISDPSARVIFGCLLFFLK